MITHFFVEKPQYFTYSFILVLGKTRWDFDRNRHAL